MQVSKPPSRQGRATRAEGGGWGAHIASLFRRGDSQGDGGVGPWSFDLVLEKAAIGDQFVHEGSRLTVSANAPKAGAQFAGWKGDIAILANPSLPTTIATIPSMAVTITATYTAQQ